jgi:hypothetical protein
VGGGFFGDGEAEAVVEAAGGVVGFEDAEGDGAAVLLGGVDEVLDDGRAYALPLVFGEDFDEGEEGFAFVLFDGEDAGRFAVYQDDLPFGGVKFLAEEVGLDGVVPAPGGGDVGLDGGDVEVVKEVVVAIGGGAKLIIVYGKMPRSR